MNPETTTGGRALKFYSSVRIDIRRVETIKKSGDSIGNRVRAKVVKNKVAPPFTEAEFDIIFGKGIDAVGEIIDLGIEYKLLSKSGAWFALADGSKIGQGKENAKEWLVEHPDKMEEIKKEIQSKLVEATTIEITRELEEEADDEDFE